MYKVTSKIVLDKRHPHKNGSFAVKLRITEGYTQKYFPINEDLTIEQWNKIQDPKAKGDNKTQFSYYKELEKRADEVIKNLYPFTFNLFQKKFFKSTNSDTGLLALIEEYCNDLIKNNQIGTADSYKCTHSSVIKHIKATKQSSPRFVDVSIDWLENYEKWLLEDGKSITTVGVYMRNIRAIMNLALEHELLNHENYPFGRHRYIIPAGRNIKKALKLEQIKEIYNYKPRHDAEERARDLWMFSYLCNGINMKDISLLQHKNIQGDKIHYLRAKTLNTKKSDRKTISANINEPMKAIIKKWGRPSLNPDDYIFDIISQKDKPEDIHRKIKQATSIINRYMNIISKALDFDIKVTTYYARHSFATILKNQDTSVEYISEALGHSSLQTTQNYLDSFEDETVVKTQEKLLNF